MMQINKNVLSPGGIFGGPTPAAETLTARILREIEDVEKRIITARQNCEAHAARLGGDFPIPASSATEPEAPGDLYKILYFLSAVRDELARLDCVAERLSAI